jgi:penicillin-binding protein 1C
LPVLPADPITRAPLPGLARHLAQHFSGRTVTTLDGALQAAVEALAARELVWLGDDADIAALVVRNRDRAVLAYLGGARFFGRAGMVDMVRAERSPGSALKPFIYAMAFDDGLATPATWVDDGALRLGTYAPRDFDRAAHGPATAADALRQSLNRPAVRLLARVGPARFAARLQDAGARLRLPSGAHPSAALALGGAGISLFELAALYADLADGGAAASLRLTQQDLRPSGRLVSPTAAAQVAGILADQIAPPGVAGAATGMVAYKTGTSYGFRDAWACGFTGDATAVVWIGRRDGSPRPGATGREVAAPLLFRLLALLPPGPPPASAPESRPTGELAPALVHMTRRAPLVILFPPGDVDLSFDPAVPVDLRATGGRPPYRWTVDGRPLSASGSHETPLWVPAEQGFAHLSVTDRDGQSASEDVRLLAE